MPLLLDPPAPTSSLTPESPIITVDAQQQVIKRGHSAEGDTFKLINKN